MKPANFEEREYETPLYNQLSSQNPNVWSPGQVFEHHIGIDYSMFLEDTWIFQMHGLRGVPPGALLSRHRWPKAWFQKRLSGRLPTFRLNLFIQAKRPEWSLRASKILRAKGFKGLYWRFEITSAQQMALELVSKQLKDRALIVYAAPTFHDHHDLFRHTRKGTIAQNSTFPSVLALKGHRAWYYQNPGASGVANPIPEQINEPTLEERIGFLLKSEEKATYSWNDNLKILSSEIIEALGSETQEETSRRASFFDTIKQLDRLFDGAEYSGAWRSFFTIQAFCEAYMVDWYVVHP